MRRRAQQKVVHHVRHARAPSLLTFTRVQPQKQRAHIAQKLGLDTPRQLLILAHLLVHDQEHEAHNLGRITRDTTKQPLPRLRPDIQHGQLEGGRIRLRQHGQQKGQVLRSHIHVAHTHRLRARSPSHRCHARMSFTRPMKALPHHLRILASRIHGHRRAQPQRQQQPDHVGTRLITLRRLRGTRHTFLYMRHPRRSRVQQRRKQRIAMDMIGLMARKQVQDLRQHLKHQDTQRVHIALLCERPRIQHAGHRPLRAERHRPSQSVVRRTNHNRIAIVTKLRWMQSGPCSHFAQRARYNVGTRTR